MKENGKERERIFSPKNAPVIETGKDEDNTMSVDLLAMIEGKMSSFSKGQKLIARYIIEHYDKAAFMTASKLGQTVGVSESTVVRFCVRGRFRRLSPVAAQYPGDDPQQIDGGAADGGH